MTTFGAIATDASHASESKYSQIGKVCNESKKQQSSRTPFDYLEAKAQLYGRALHMGFISATIFMMVLIVVDVWTG